MNGSPSIQSSTFTPPAPQPILAANTFVFYTFNLLTLGFHGAFEKLSQENRIKQLRLNQQELQEQIAAHCNEWDSLENNLGDLLEQFKSMAAEDDFRLATLKRGLSKLSAENGKLYDQEIKATREVTRTVAEVALSIISFVGLVLANVLTLGIYGAVMNYKLNERIVYLEDLNNHITKEFSDAKANRSDKIRKVIEFAEANLSVASDFQKVETELSEVKKTDQGKAYDEAKKAKQSLADMQAKQADLQRDLAALRAQKVHAEQGKKKVEGDLIDAQRDLQDLRQRNQLLGNADKQLRHDIDALNAAVAQRDGEVAKRKKELADLQVQFNVARQKAAEVQRLEKEISRLKDAGKYQPEVQKLQTQLGPVAPKYNPKKGVDEQVAGAMDLDENDDSLSQEWIDFAKEYKKRYGDDKRSAAAIMEESFGYAFNQLIDMAAKGDKIKINKSYETGTTPGAHAVFRYMAYDLVKGAKLTDNGCHGFKLKINDNVEMLPSQPEKVLEFKPEAKGGFKPTVIVHHKQRDDFTPSEETIGQNGVDPVGAKWIFEQLTDEEEAHLLNLLLNPVIENNHPDYVKTKDYMRNQHDPRVQLVQTAYELLEDMGVAFSKKFGSTLFPKCWQQHTDDFDIPPFVKPDDVQPDLTKISDDADVKGSTATVDWTIDMDVIGDKRGGMVRQPTFVDKIMFTKVKYESYFNNLDENIVAHPDVEGNDYKYITWDQGKPSLNQQYYISHQMIGSDQYFNGGQRCLFSNLLAILVSDKSDLTEPNVHCLRKAMAAYLDKLQQAKDEWKRIKDLSPLPKDGGKIKELAELANSFETAILKTHRCTVASYQLWLRNEPGGWTGTQWVHPANIDISNLTQLEIQLCAWTFGVKIGVLIVRESINKLESPTTVDEYGRIVPSGDYYGPNTKELLMMMCTGGSYYGAFPKLHLADVADVNDTQNLIDLSEYWREIDMNKK